VAELVTELDADLDAELDADLDAEFIEAIEAIEATFVMCLRRAQAPKYWLLNWTLSWTLSLSKRSKRSKRSKPHLEILEVFSTGSDTDWQRPNPLNNHLMNPNIKYI
jgi:hypothetical protein